MQQLFERLVELFGKSPDSEEFQKFLADIDETPIVHPSSEDAELLHQRSRATSSFLPDETEGKAFRKAPTLYNFPKSYFMLVVDNGWISYALLHLRSGERSFNTFPAGITKADERADVQTKLGKPPSIIEAPQCKVGEIKDHYDMDPVVLSLGFDTTTQQMTSASMCDKTRFESRHERVKVIAESDLEGASFKENTRSERSEYRKLFDGYAEDGVKTIMLAQEEARRLGHNCVGSEQLLLGLLGEGRGCAAKTLKSKGLNIKEMRAEIDKIVGRGSGFVAVEIPFAPEVKEALNKAREQAVQLGHDYICSGHLLLGLLDVGDGIAFSVLGNLGVYSDDLRAAVLRLLKDQDDLIH